MPHAAEREARAPLATEAVLHRARTAQLLRAAATGPEGLEPVLCDTSNHCTEKPVSRSEDAPLAATREDQVKQRSPVQPKINKIF